MEKVMTHKVITTPGNGLVKEHESDALATVDADFRNKKAETLGIQTRYEVKPIEK